jgi:response regulator RpfG family c-di-GMP phosphodiesterase
MPTHTIDSRAERIRVFVDDAFDTTYKLTHQLASEGYDVTVCPGDRAGPLVSELEGKGTELVLVHVRTCPIGALEMLRAAVLLCRMLGSRRPPVVMLTAAPESRGRRALART